MEILAEIFTWVTQLIDSLSQLVTDSPLTYLLIFGLVAFDVIIPILPSESIVTAAAVLAGQGQLDIVWVLMAAGLGAFVGDDVAYWIGRAAGRPLIEKVLRGRTDRLEDVERQFQIRGGAFIIVGRFIPGGRTVVAIGAGVLHFDWLKFIAYDFVAVVIWALLAAIPGYIGGVVVQDKPWLALVIGFGLSMLVAMGMLLFQRWRDGNGRTDEPRGEGASTPLVVAASDEVLEGDEDG